MSKLSQKQIKSNLSKFPGWKLEKDSIVKQFKFKDFVESLSFVTAVGMEAEKMNHHPDILMSGWNKVKIILSTHDAGGVTAKDFSLAKKIEERIK
jgi:4a-hydroxytetrahydrobiopterin dehydratase